MPSSIGVSKTIVPPLLRRTRHGTIGLLLVDWIIAMNPTPEERFLAKIAVSNSGCWLWTAFTYKGYGKFQVGWKEAWLAHRWSYEHFVGPIPEGLQIDHLCHTEAYRRGECKGGEACPHRRCVNPRHLETVTSAQNSERGNLGSNSKAKTHCPQGHEYTLENTRVWRGERKCRACEKAQNRRQYLRRKALGLSLGGGGAKTGDARL